MTELRLGNITYILEKIKPEDRFLFLEGCKIMGRKCYCCFPFYCGHITKEYKLASEFFSKGIKEATKETK